MTQSPYSETNGHCHRIARRFWFPALAMGLIIVLYRETLLFPLIWDDPLWYRQGAGQSLLELLGPTPGYQFYRPLALLLSNAYLQGGTVNVLLAHCVQVIAHTLNTLFLAGLLVHLGVPRLHARIAALFFALHPFSYQAVAWQGAHQPVSLLLILSSACLAARYAARRQRVALFASWVVYALALLFQESAVAFIWLYLWIGLHPWLKTRVRCSQEIMREARWLVPYLALAGTYIMIWWMMPKLDGFASLSPDTLSAAYLLQAVVAPLASLLQYMHLPLLPGQMLCILLIAALALTVLVWRSVGWERALLCACWIGSGLAPVWLGLEWSYIRVGSRLVYQAIPGIALLWISAFAMLKRLHPGAVGRWLASMLCLAVFALYTGQVIQQDVLWRAATRLQTQALEAMSTDGSSLLFLNYPDQIALQEAPFSLGYWGIVLAPVAVDMSDYAAASIPTRLHTFSLSMPATGAADREQSGFAVDMRGKVVGPEELAMAALEADDVYVARYSGKSINLEEVGGTRSKGDPGEKVYFGDAIALEDYWLLLEQDRVVVNLAWYAVDRAAFGETVFVHLLSADGRYLAGADGDLLGGTLPLVYCPVKTSLADRRVVDATELHSQECLVTVGIYNRDSGVRLEAQAPGFEIRDNEVVLGKVCFE